MKKTNQPKTSSTKAKPKPQTAQKKKPQNRDGNMRSIAVEK